MKPIDQSFWKGKSVFMTGHTGFKGGWLATWLAEMGSAVHGYGLPPVTKPSYFAMCDLTDKISCVTGDVRDAQLLSNSMQSAQPKVVFHLAAQPLVRRS